MQNDLWTPKVLSEYEIGRSVSAIEAIHRSDKPLAEVGCLAANLADLEADLLGCLDLAGDGGAVRFWIREAGSRFRYGFHREAWAIQALDFLDGAELGRADRAWISGLLFGYRPSAIQQYIDREAEAPTRQRIAASG